MKGILMMSAKEESRFRGRTSYYIKDYEDKNSPFGFHAQSRRATLLEIKVLHNAIDITP